MNFFKLQLGLGEVLHKRCLSLQAIEDRDNPICQIGEYPTEITISRIFPNVPKGMMESTLLDKCVYYASLLKCETVLMLVRIDTTVEVVNNGSNYYVFCIGSFIDGAGLKEIYSPAVFIRRVNRVA
jgi:hypothetical protein